MDEFEIPITYKGLDWAFSAKVLHLGYTYKIQVDVDGTMMLFEPDENRQFRAVLANQEVSTAKSVDKGLIETISETLDSLLGSE
jgi:hypothetical protein